MTSAGSSPTVSERLKLYRELFFGPFFVLKPKIISGNCLRSRDSIICIIYVRNSPSPYSGIHYRREGGN
ncbi:MAG: hypothetical protein CVV24_12440 [Ignavibacteriae bacterium HGW-Ignavibacteriae-3]|nr:MAG: hypothetical protein CVV24_12440 [Ignavibacteriae bacterium HGW-Ignavibacteriae-3]